MIFRRFHILFMLVFSFSLNGQTNIKTMFYNLLNYDFTPDSKNRTHNLKTILEEIKPDIFMVCELKNEDASNYMLNEAILPFNANFSAAKFKYSQSPATDLLQMVYYNSTKLELESYSVIPTYVRDINHYTFKIKTENTASSPLRIEVFVTHLKASRGIENRNKRLSSTEIFVRELERLPENSYVIFAGDFNFYTSNEDGFKRIINTSNAIQIIDPINRLCPDFPNDGKDYFGDDYNSTYFWNNSSFKDIHSQSTRTTPLTDGAGGGMDDRFDFIMISKNLTSSTDLFYENNSYKTIGNNGNCYNSYVSNSSCNGAFSQNLRNALYNFSDHLPIVLNLKTPQSILSVKKVQPISLKNSNLVSDFLSIKINSSIKKIIIYNQLGQIVKESYIYQKENFKINTSSFNKGIYYLKADSYKPLKFVKI